LIDTRGESLITVVSDILRYRRDRAVYYLTEVRRYGRPVNFRIFVSALPRERVFPGCYFSTLNTRSPLTQRPISRLRGGNSVSVIEIIRTLRRLGAHLCSINAEGDRSTGATGGRGREGGGARVKERSCAARARKAQKGSKRGDGRSRRDRYAYGRRDGTLPPDAEGVAGTRREYQ